MDAVKGPVVPPSPLEIAVSSPSSHPVGSPSPRTAAPASSGPPAGVAPPLLVDGRPVNQFEESLLHFLSVRPGQTKNSIADALFPYAKNRGSKIKQINTALYGMERASLVYRNGTKAETLKPFWYSAVSLPQAPRPANGRAAALLGPGGDVGASSGIEGFAAARSGTSPSLEADTSGSLWGGSGSPEVLSSLASLSVSVDDLEREVERAASISNSGAVQSPRRANVPVSHWNSSWPVLSSPGKNGDRQQSRQSRPATTAPVFPNRDLAMPPSLGPVVPCVPDAFPAPLERRDAAPQWGPPTSAPQTSGPSLASPLASGPLLPQATDDSAGAASQRLDVDFRLPASAAQFRSHLAPYSAFGSSPLGSPAHSPPIMSHPQLPEWSSNLFGFLLTPIIILLNLDHFPSQVPQIARLFQQNPRILQQQTTTLCFSSSSSIPIPFAWRIDSSVASAELYLATYVGVLLCHPKMGEVQSVLVASKDAKAVASLLGSFGIRCICVLNPAQDLLPALETVTNGSGRSP